MTTLPRIKRCPHCRAEVRDLELHLRDPGDLKERPPTACPVLFALRQPKAVAR